MPTLPGLVLVAASTLGAVTLLPSTQGQSSPQQRFGLSQPMPRIDGTIRIATYNLLNYFDQEDDPKLQGKYDDFGDNPGPTSEARCRELAQVIRAIDADVLALQEVESAVALEHFNNTWLQGMGYRHVASEDVGYYRGCEQSVLSRFPITSTRIWPEADLRAVRRTGGGWAPIPGDARPDEFRFQRSPLAATIRTPDGYELDLIVVHQKSGRDQWRREGEALQIVEYVAQRQQKGSDANIVVLGDFNAQPWDRSIQVYREAGLIDAMNMRAGTHHTNAEHGYASPLRKTHTSGRVIDHILLNHAAVGELVAGSGFVLGTSAEEYDWMNEPPPAGYASDHYPVVVDLVPREGMGYAAEASPWPRAATRTALRRSPIEVTDPTVRSGGAAPSGGSAEPASNDGFVASKRSAVFHLANCANAARIAEKNRTPYRTIAEATEAGKRPAKCCNPGA